jgi:hypothetical protein
VRVYYYNHKETYLMKSLHHIDILSNCVRLFMIEMSTKPCDGKVAVTVVLPPCHV